MSICASLVRGYKRATLQGSCNMQPLKSILGLWFCCSIMVILSSCSSSSNDEPDFNMPDDETTRPGDENSLNTGDDDNVQDPSSNNTSTEPEDAALFRLTNQFLGEDSALVVDFQPDGSDIELGFTIVRDIARAEWVITPVDSGFYRISNRALGEFLSLDTVREQNRNRVVMAASSNDSSQRWMVTPLNTGFCRLTNEFLGPDFSLDTNNDVGVQLQPFVRETGNFTGQFWMLGSLGSATDETLLSCEGSP